jgi:UDP-N-acetyl-D-mannosaminuronate dehydrogenase
MAEGVIELVGDPPESAARSEVSILCVDAPYRGGRVDLSDLSSAARSVARGLAAGGGRRLVIVNTPIPPETSRKVLIPIIERESGLRVGEGVGYAYVAYVPWDCLYRLEAPSKIVIGSVDDSSSSTACSLYQEVYRGRARVIRASVESAELVCYAESLSRSVNIGLAATLARICEVTQNSDVREILGVFDMDLEVVADRAVLERLESLLGYACERGVDSGLIRSLLGLCSEQARWIASRLEELLGALAGRVVAILGFHEPLTEALADTLGRAGARVRVYDPEAFPGLVVGGFEWCGDLASCLREADIAIVVARRGVFLGLSPEDFRRYMRRPIVLDYQGIYDEECFKARGVLLVRVGSHLSRLDSRFSTM